MPQSMTQTITGKKLKNGKDETNMKITFDDATVTRKVREKLRSFEHLDLGGALESIDTDGENYTSITEEENQVMLKVDKKSNIPGVIQNIISQLSEYLSVDRKTVNTIFQIHNYNSIIYITKKY